jgi:translation elongation factor EF-1alpha
MVAMSTTQVTLEAVTEKILILIMSESVGVYMVQFRKMDTHGMSQERVYDPVVAIVLMFFRQNLYTYRVALEAES